MDDDREDYISKIKDSILSGMDDELQNAVEGLNYHLMDFSSFPDNIFETLIKLIKLDNFFRMEKGFCLLMIFGKTYYLDLLNETQKLRVSQVLEGIYPKLEWGNMCMVSVEFFVDAYRDDRSLKILKNLINVEAEGPKGLMPYGLYYFSDICEDPHLKKEAFELLKSLLDNKSELVRYEAKLHFDKLSAKYN